MQNLKITSFKIEKKAAAVQITVNKNDTVCYSNNDFALNALVIPIFKGCIGDNFFLAAKKGCIGHCQ